MSLKGVGVFTRGWGKSNGPEIVMERRRTRTCPAVNRCKYRSTTMGSCSGSSKEIWRTFLEDIVDTGEFADHRASTPEGMLECCGGEMCIRTVWNKHRNKERGRVMGEN